eukprot:365003-Chlamydomonas_euryale.AAC.5
MATTVSFDGWVPRALRERLAGKLHTGLGTPSRPVPSRHITSHHITSHHITSHHITSHHMHECMHACISFKLHRPWRH